MTREYFEQTLFAVRDVEFPFANKCKLQLVNLNILIWNHNVFLPWPFGSQLFFLFTRKPNLRCTKFCAVSLLEFVSKWLVSIQTLQPAESGSLLKTGLMIFRSEKRLCCMVLTFCPKLCRLSMPVTFNQLDGCIHGVIKINSSHALSSVQSPCGIAAPLLKIFLALDVTQTCHT